MSFFSLLAPFSWSEQIIGSDPSSPYYRCFDKYGRVVGYVRLTNHNTAPLYRAILVTDHKTCYEERIATCNTLENAKLYAKLCVERNLS